MIRPKNLETIPKTSADSTATAGSKASHIHQRAMFSGNHNAPNTPTRKTVRAMGPEASQGSNFFG